MYYIRDLGRGWIVAGKMIDVTNTGRAVMMEVHFHEGDQYVSLPMLEVVALSGYRRVDLSDLPLAVVSKLVRF